MKVIDSHQHFWIYNSARDTWIDDSMDIIRRDFLPKDLEEILVKNNIEACVAVQADQSETETEFLLQCAQDNSFIKGVVGWVDLKRNTIEERLEYYSENPNFKGVRHIAQNEPSGFMLSNDFQEGISKLSTYNLTYDILIYPNQLPEAIQLAEKFKNQLFVIDHMAKPKIQEHLDDDWKEGMLRLSLYENVYCKLSGLVTEALWNQWSIEDFRPYIDFVLDNFGSDRLIFGSDWPVCLLSASYKNVLDIVGHCLNGLAYTERSKIMRENAIKFYNLNL